MSRSNIHILCTNDVDGDILSTASANGLVMDVIPFINTAFNNSDATREEISKLANIPAAVIFTSAVAVEAVADVPGTNESRWDIFCLSGATRLVCEKKFPRSKIQGTGDDAAGLATSIINFGPRELFFFCGNERRDELPSIMAKNKTRLIELQVYQTIQVPRKIEERYDAILFFSPSSVKSFFQENSVTEKVILFAIGRTTAVEIQKFSKNKIIIGDRPGKKALLENAINYFQSNTIHHGNPLTRD